MQGKEEVCGARVWLNPATGLYTVKWRRGTAITCKSKFEAAYRIATRKYRELTLYPNREVATAEVVATIVGDTSNLSVFTLTSRILRILEQSALYQYRVKQYSATRVEVEFKSYRIELWGTINTGLPTHVFGFPTEELLMRRGYRFVVRPGIFSLSRILPKSRSVKVWRKVVPDIGTELREISAICDFLPHWHTW